ARRRGRPAAHGGAPGGGRPLAARDPGGVDRAAGGRPAPRGGAARPAARPGRRPTRGPGPAPSPGPHRRRRRRPRPAVPRPAGAPMTRLFMDVTPLRESPAFRRLWVGSGLSAIGTQMTMFAVALQVYTLTHSSAA